MKYSDENLYLGRAVLERNLVPREAVLECLMGIASVRRSGNGLPPHSLGSALVSTGHLTEAEVEKILSERRIEPLSHEWDDSQLERELLERKVISPEEAQRCRLIKKERDAGEGKGSTTLSHIVMEEGLVTREELASFGGSCRKVNYACPGCSVRISAVPLAPGKRYRCRKCDGILEPQAARSHNPPSALPIREGDRPQDDQFEIDRAVALYLKQHQMVRRDQLRHVQRLQTEFFRYGLVVPIPEILRRLEALPWQAMERLRRIDFSRVVREPGWKNQAVPGYRLGARIASGGFAALWTATATFTGGQRAVKILHPERAGDFRSLARFKREAELLTRFDSPYIVHGIEYGCEGPSHFLVMEYVEGRSLGQFISETGAIPTKEALGITRQVALALRYLHQEGYLHRDIKPDNVLIASSGKIKLCDLGFAAPIPESALEGAQKSTRVGTAGYVSPEVMRGEPDAGVGADIYSLGILLYALLTGHEPFAGASSEEVVTEQIESSSPIPNLLKVPASPEVVHFLKRMMHPDRERRFGAVGEVIAGLDRMGQG